MRRSPGDRREHRNVLRNERGNCVLRILLEMGFGSELADRYIVEPRYICGFLEKKKTRKLNESTTTFLSLDTPQNTKLTYFAEHWVHHNYCPCSQTDSESPTPPTPLQTSHWLP